MSNSTTSRPKREPVLIVINADQHLEVFSGKNIDFKIVRAPRSNSVAGAIVAEDAIEAVLPRKFKALYFPGLLRASASTRPLSPTTARETLAVSRLIKGLNQIELGMEVA